MSKQRNKGFQIIKAPSALDDKSMIKLNRF